MKQGEINTTETAREETPYVLALEEASDGKKQVGCLGCGESFALSKQIEHLRQKKSTFASVERRLVEDAFLLQDQALLQALEWHCSLFVVFLLDACCPSQARAERSRSGALALRLLFVHAL